MNPTKSRGGRPPKDVGIVAAGLELVRGGLTPEEAAERLTAAGRPVSARTLYRAMAATAPRPQAAPVMAISSEPEPTPAAPATTTSARPLPVAKLGELRDLIARLPFAQQDALVSTLPIERIRSEAIARGIAPYPVAAEAVTRELRAVSL